MENFVKQILLLLGVPFTGSYLRQTVATLPYGGTLFGLSTVLEKYGVENRSVRLTHKEDLTDIDLPAVVMWEGRFAIMENAGEDMVALRMPDGESKRVAKAGFIENWDGIAMLLSASAHASEPDIADHRCTERMARLKKWLAAGCAVILALAAAVMSPWHGSWIWWALIATDAAGILVAFLLLQKQLHIASPVADRLCGLIHDSHCEDVTNSDGADLLGMVKLSEVGAGFFGVNLAVLLFMPQAMFWMGAVAVAVLPFTFWSVWYQRFRAHSWCVLCLATLALMWIQAAFCVAGGVFTLPSGGWAVAAGLCCGYALAVLLLNRLMSALEERRQGMDWNRRYNELKAQDRVVSAYLADAPKLDTSGENCSSMLFGSPEARRSITVFSNPYCGPCAMMHRRIKDMPGSNVNVRYVMTWFSDDRSDINRLMIAAYLQLGAERTWDLMTRWYDGGKELGAEFFSGLGLNPDAPEVIGEFEKHKRWRDGNPHLSGTPTVLFNGRLLPVPYGPEDYPYLPVE